RWLVSSKINVPSIVLLCPNTPPSYLAGICCGACAGTAFEASVAGSMARGRWAETTTATAIVSSTVAANFFMRVSSYNSLLGKRFDPFSGFFEIRIIRREAQSFFISAQRFGVLLGHL